MYRRRSLGPRLSCRILLTVPPAVLAASVAFLYMVMVDDPARPRPVWVTVAAPLTVLGRSSDIASSAFYLFLDAVLWIAVLNGLITIGALLLGRRP